MAAHLLVVHLEVVLTIRNSIHNSCMLARWAKHYLALIQILHLCSDCVQEGHLEAVSKGRRRRRRTSPMEASTTTMETSTALMLGDLNCP